MIISVNPSNDMTYGYKAVNVPFFELPMITGQRNYSVGVFTGGWDKYGKFHEGFRTRECLVGTSDMLMYDFDDGYPLAECVEYFESVRISAYFATSKSHQVEKKGKPACDRYRLLIPFDKPINLPFGQYQKFYMFIAALLGLDELNDHTTQDPTRFFFPNPNQHTSLVNTGQVLNFDVLLANFNAYNEITAEKEQKTQKKNYKPTTTGQGGLKKNEISRTTMIETRRGNFQFQDFEYLQGNQTVPCRCVSPSHPDRDPSAFVGRSHASGALFVKCSGCGYIAWMGAE